MEAIGTSLKTKVNDVYKRARASLLPNAHAQNRMQELFGEGYDSGDIEKGLDDPLVLYAYETTGGNYKTIFDELLKPRLKTSKVVLEIGPGKGSWTKAVLANFSGTLCVIDRLPEVEAMLRKRCPDAGDRLRFYQTK